MTTVSFAPSYQKSIPSSCCKKSNSVSSIDEKKKFAILLKGMQFDLIGVSKAHFCQIFQNGSIRSSWCKKKKRFIQCVGKDPAWSKGRFRHNLGSGLMRFHCENKWTSSYFWNRSNSVKLMKSISWNYGKMSIEDRLMNKMSCWINCGKL